LISEKDKDIPEKEGQPTKCILKILLTLNTQRSNKRAAHKTICTSMHYTTMLLNPMINLNLLEKMISYVFMSTKKSKLNQFSSISKGAKFKVLQSYLFYLLGESVR
jgi:hypothetical protein